VWNCLPTHVCKLLQVVRHSRGL